VVEGVAVTEDRAAGMVVELGSMLAQLATGESRQSPDNASG